MCSTPVVRPPGRWTVRVGSSVLAACRSSSLVPDLMSLGFLAQVNTNTNVNHSSASTCSAAPCHTVCAAMLDDIRSTEGGVRP